MNKYFDFGILSVARDSYRQQYNDAKARHDERIAQVKKDFLGDRYRAEMQAADAEFAESVKAAKEEIGGEILQRVEAERERIHNRVKTGSLTGLHELKMIQDLPISVTEYADLVSKLGGKSYWTDRMLLTIAEKNDIIGDFGIEPDIGTQLSVLDSCLREVDNLFEYWDGDSYKGFAALSDKTVTGLEDRYGMFTGKQTSAQRASRAFSRILAEPDIFNRGLQLRNALTNFEGDTDAKEALLYRISQKNTFTDVSLRFAGQDVFESVMDYRAGRKPAPVMTEEEKAEEEPAADNGQEE